MKRPPRSDLVFAAPVMAANFKFIRARYGTEMEERLYREVGMTRADFEDEDCWISYDTALKLNLAMVELTGEPNVTYLAGLHHPYTEEVGLLYSLVKHLASPAEVFKRIPAMTNHLSRITAFEVLEVGETHARLRFTVKEGYADHPLFDLKRKGTLASLPMAFDLPPAAVVEEECISHGAPACIYRVTWERRRRRRGLPLLAIALCSAAATFVGLSMGHVLLGLLLGLAFSFAGFVGFFLATPHRLGSRAHESARQEAMRLERAILRLDEKSNRLELLWEISDLLHRAHDEASLLRTATDMVRRRLGFDRVLFWGVGGGRFEAVLGSGLSKELEEKLSALWIPLHPERRREGPVVALFGPILESGRGLTVTDVKAYREGLSLRGREMLDTIDPGPFVVVPLPRAEAGGILAADRNGPHAKVDAHDRFMLEQVANQLGLALENVRLLEEERRARDLAQKSLEMERKVSLYLNPEAREKLCRESTAELHAEEILVAVLFVDVVGFTAVAEGHSPRVTLAWLNMLFMLADGVLERWGGIIDKRLGDGILAVFRGEGAAARALGASGELHQKVLELDEPARAMGAREIRLRSGLTCGPVVAGTIGTQVRYEYTVIGRVVNLAQRLQAHGNEGETVLSLPAWKEAGEPIEATPEEHWMFRGFPEPIGFRRIVHRQASSIESTFAHAQETP